MRYTSPKTIGHVQLTFMGGGLLFNCELKMSAVTRRALRVYAALSELRSRDEDVLDALIPFFDPIFGSDERKSI